MHELHVAVIGGWAPSLVQFRGDLLRQLVTRGHRVTAMAADGTPGLVEKLAAIGVAFEDLDLARTGLDPRQDLRTLRALVNRLRRLQPDVVFAYTIKPVIYGMLAARIAGARRRYAMITGLGYAFAGSGFRRRVLKASIATMYRVALRGCDGLFLQNHDDRADLTAARALPRAIDITVVRGSGVDPTRFGVEPLPDGPLRFVFVGRLLKEKGLLDVIEMARRLRSQRSNARVVVVGGLDPNPASIDRSVLESWISDDVIDYLGEVDDVRPALCSSHVLVLPSYREGTPRSVLEAMSMGRPVIVSDVPGCRDTIVDGIHGLLVPVRDPEALTAAAQCFIEQPELVAQMGTRARARILDLYDARTIAAQMVDVMEL